MYYYFIIQTLYIIDIIYNRYIKIFLAVIVAYLNLVL